MSDEDRLALLVGAGLNVDAGLPTSVGLARKLRTALSELVSGKNKGAAASEREDAEAFLALYNFLDGGVRFHEGIHNRNPDQPVNIEQVAVAAIELQARANSPVAVYSAGWNRRLEQLEAAKPALLSSFVDFTYSRLEEWLTAPEAKNASYLRGLRELVFDDRGLDIFTLNYDSCIETALQTASLKFCNGFNQAGVWSPETLSAECSVRLCKLHGSLDWVDDEIYGVCSTKYPRHENSDTMVGDSTRPLLIFGTAHKLSPREPFLSLAYHFSQRVLRTKVLSIVGYSFGDEHVNQIIEQGLKKNPALRLVVGAPNVEETVRSIRFLDRNPRVIPVRGGAKELLNDRTLVDAVKQVLKEVSAGGPFN